MSNDLKTYQQALKESLERFGLFPGSMEKPENVAREIQAQTSARPRWEHLNSGLVRCLILGIQAVHRNHRNKFHYVRDLDIGHTAAANFQKLRFHGLIAHADEKASRSGEWLITKRGGQFLRGEIAVPKSVKVCRNTVIEHSKEAIHLKQFKNLPPDFNPIYAYEEPILINPGKQSLFA